MPEWPAEKTPPLPREWLPEGSPGEGSPEWERALVRVVAASAPGVARLRQRRAPARGGWASELGSWWRVSAALATTAAALLVLLRPSPFEAAPGPATLPLAVVTTQGDPRALFEGLGIPADPVLALITLEGRGP